MSAALDNAASRDARMEAILHDYLQALDAGHRPDPQAILGRHPFCPRQSAILHAVKQTKGVSL